MLRITGRTRLIALFGYPLEFVPTPHLLNSAFAASDLDFTCIPFEIKRSNLESAMAALRALGMVGANISRPFKEEVVPLLDRLGPTAAFVGTVDTISLQKGTLIGHNSDYHAFLNSLREGGGSGPKGKTAVILGAGAAACAISAALLREGLAALHIANRTRERAETLVKRLKEKFPEARLTVLPWEREVAADLPDADLLINTTPGDSLNTPHGPLLMEHDLHPALTVFDLNHSATTPLLMMARHSGCTTISGNRMWLWHSMLSFQLWTGQEPPRSAMEAALAAWPGIISSSI